MHTPENEALRRDAADPGHRHLFHIPPADGGRHPDTAYLAGNSLGLQPRATRDELLADLDAWSRLGVEGHLESERPWLPYHELLTAPAARLVGALPAETVVMNSLTVNLHLLMVSFYRPAGERTRIVIEDSAFPSDSYAVRSQARFHGLDPDTTVVRLKPRPGSDTLGTEDVLDFLAREGHTVALLMLGGVNYLTGELMDIPAITAAGRAAGAVVGWDLAHAAGNVPLSLHDWDVDFAAWCSYKYLNSGPGALGGVFVHERHLGDPSIPRFEGWWSTEAATRFEMTPVSRPPATVEAWQISNPPIFAMGPVRTSLELFDSVGMPALRERSLRLTAWLEQLLDEVTPGRPLTVVTPRDPARRGCQLSVRIGVSARSEPGLRAPQSRTEGGWVGSANELTKRLRHEHGVVADAREPDIVRFAPVPLYSTYHDCWRVAEALAATFEKEGS
ncbi:kynureninase [Micromonospora tulbaghiae]|uniref:kynureninase n=1 Tax=Micromonospora tulbaghiae TaxID=479978 RepID=UPI00371B20C8